MWSVGRARGTCDQGSVRAPELFEKRLMCKKVDVLQVVIRLVLSMHLFLWLAGMDALQDAEAPTAQVTLACGLVACTPHDKEIQPVLLWLFAGHGAHMARAHLNSASRSCNRLTARVRVMYFATFPALPCSTSHVQFQRSTVYPQTTATRLVRVHTRCSLRPIAQCRGFAGKRSDQLLSSDSASLTCWMLIVCSRCNQV